MAHGLRYTDVMLNFCRSLTLFLIAFIASSIGVEMAQGAILKTDPTKSYYSGSPSSSQYPAEDSRIAQTGRLASPSTDLPKTSRSESSSRQDQTAAARAGGLEDLGNMIDFFASDEGGTFTERVRHLLYGVFVKPAQSVFGAYLTRAALGLVAPIKVFGKSLGSQLGRYRGRVLMNPLGCRNLGSLYGRTSSGMDSSFQDSANILRFFDRSKAAN